MHNNYFLIEKSDNNLIIYHDATKEPNKNCTFQEAIISVTNLHELSAVWLDPLNTVFQA